MEDINEKTLGIEPTKEPTLEDKLISKMSNSEEPLDALQLSRAIFGPKAAKKKVNPTLYHMLNKGIISKLDPIKGQKPRWELK